MTPDSNELLARLTDRELYDNSCITRHQLANWVDSDYASHIGGLKHTIEFLLRRLDALSAPVPSPDGAAAEVSPYDNVKQSYREMIAAAKAPSSDDVRSALADELEALHRIDARSGVAFKCADNIDKIIAALRSAPVSGPAASQMREAIENLFAGGFVEAGLRGEPSEWKQAFEQRTKELKDSIRVPAVGVTREAMRERYARAIYDLNPSWSSTQFSGPEPTRWCYDTPEKQLAYKQADAILALSPVPDATVSEPLQSRVLPWLLQCFGPTIPYDKTERNHRFLEEALELVQACGCTQDEAHQLVDYVYGRDQGDINQEVGGVMITLAALCIANGFDMHAAGETELARIWTKVEQIRAKQAAKSKHSPLPVSYFPQQVDREATVSARDAVIEQPSFVFYECKVCGFSSVQPADFKGSDECPICAGDCGHSNTMSCRTARSTDKPEGRDARSLASGAKP